MRKIWAYGCSYTNRFGIDNIIYWPELVSITLNCEFKNNGMGGSSNFESRNRLIKDLSNIETDDIVIFQFTFPVRFYINYLDIQKKTFLNRWYFKDYKINENYNKKDYEIWLDFVLNFDLELLLHDFYNTEPLFDYIEEKLKANVKYWFISDIPEDQHKNFFNYKRTIIFNNSNNEKTLNGGNYIAENDFTLANDIRKGTIKDKRFENDQHPNQEGHNFFAKNIIDSINKKKYL